MSLDRRSALRRAGLGLLASLLPKALKALPRGKAGSGGGGSSPATIRVTVSSTNYDLAISTATSEGQWNQSATSGIVQDWYNIPITGPLASAMPGLVVKWRPDNATSSQYPRYEVICEMSAAIGPNQAALPNYTVQLLTGASAQVPMTYGDGTACATANVGAANALSGGAGHFMGQSWRIVSAVRPVIVTPATMVSTGATPTYSNYGSLTPVTTIAGYGLTAYVPLSACGINFSGQSGPRFDLGLRPEWTSQWLALSDANGLACMLIGAEVTGTLSCIWRDSSGQLFNMDTFPNYTRAGGGGTTQYAGNTSTLTPAQDTYYSWSPTHFGSHAYVPFLATGDPYYLERQQGIINTLMQNFQTGPQNTGVLNTTGTEERGVAWMLRELWSAAYLTPASGLPSPMLSQAYFLTKLQNNYQYLNDAYLNSALDQIQNFHTLWGSFPNWGGAGFMHYYRSQVINAMVWAGFTNWQQFIDWDAFFLTNVGNATSGWGRTQAVGSYGGYYHGAFANADNTAAANWSDLWDLNLSPTYSNFTGTISGGTTLTISGLSGVLMGQNAQAVIGSGVAANTLLLSGTGTSFVLDLSSSNLGPVSMAAQIGVPTGPWVIHDSDTFWHDSWQSNQLTPDQTVGVFDLTQPIPSLTMTDVAGFSTDTYAASLRGAIAQGHSTALTPILAKSEYSTGQFDAFLFSYKFISATPVTIPSASTDSFFVSPKQPLQPASTIIYANTYTEVTIQTGTLLLLQFINHDFMPQALKSNIVQFGILTVISTGGGQLQTSDGFLWDMATNDWDPTTVPTDFGPFITISKRTGSGVHGGSALAIGGTYQCGTPAGLTAKWFLNNQGSGVSATISSFTAAKGIWTANVAPPASAGLYLLQVTGASGNTAVSDKTMIFTIT